jgi:hypothetical protein
VRTNRPKLKSAARRVFSLFWSARRHPIYRLIEVSDDIIEQNCVVSRSGLYNQHQGMDAILEEINKTLKSLIPPVPQLKHWKIAARNCKKFIQVIVIKHFFIC